MGIFVSVLYVVLELYGFGYIIVEGINYGLRYGMVYFKWIVRWLKDNN